MSVRGEYRFMKFMEKNKGWCSLECLFTSQISYRHRYCAYTYYFSLSLPLSLARSHTDTEPRNKCLLCCCRRCRTIQKRGFISFNSRVYDGTGAGCVCVYACTYAHAGSGQGSFRHRDCTACLSVHGVLLCRWHGIVQQFARACV